jgi:hypothetical protein
MDDQQVELMRREAAGETFVSAEARYEFEKARRLRLVVRVTAAALAVLVFGGFMYWLGGGGRGGARGGGADDGHSHGDGHSHSPIEIEPVGSPVAGVKVICILPEDTGCHASIIEFLTEAAESDPARIRAEFKGMADFSEEAMAASVGEICAAVLINDQARFRVAQSGGAYRDISLVGTVPTHYSIGDVATALTHVFMAAYPDAEKPAFAPSEAEMCSPPVPLAEPEDELEPVEGLPDILPLQALPEG